MADPSSVLIAIATLYHDNDLKLFISNSIMLSCATKSSATSHSDVFDILVVLLKLGADTYFAQPYIMYTTFERVKLID